MSDTYTPTMEDLIRQYRLPFTEIAPRGEDEGFADWVTRAHGIAGHQEIVRAEQAARRAVAAHDAQVAADALNAAADDVDLGWTMIGDERTNAEASAEVWLRSRATRLQEGQPDALE